MSGICGLYNLDGAPVNGDVLRRMVAAAAFRGPDGISYWTAGPIGLAHLALHTTPESRRERQPLCSRDGRLCLAADARVDNRAELISALASRGVHLEDPTDADLILAAYETWGIDCPKEIIGDFAFALWDGRERRLFCARDPIGVRPLFYCRRGQTLFFATTIESIVAGLGERPPWNEPLLVDYLCWWFDRWVNETIYQGILRLPAAHGLEVRPKGERLARYWTLGLQPGPGYKTDEEYIEHFRRLFAEAVRCRLRSNTPVGIAVSGGLDSSSIACMAYHLLAQDLDIQTQVRLYSCVFKDIPSADERRYVQAVLDECQRLPATCIPGEGLWGFQEEGQEGTPHLDEPDMFHMRSMMTAPLREARGHGCRVMLMGEGGDQVLSSHAYSMPELMVDVRPRRLWAEFGHFWRRNRRAALRTLVRNTIVPALKPLVPKRILEWRRARRQQRYQQARWRAVPEWVNREKVKLFDRADLGETPDPATWLPSRSAEVAYHQLTGGWYTATLSYIGSLGAALGMEYRIPFLDRRLVDFLLQSPPHLRFADGLSKVILRRALAGILAEEVRQRTTRGRFEEVADRGVREKERARLAVLRESTATSLGPYLHQERLAFSWQMYYNATASPTRLLLAPVLFQAWLQSLPAAGAGDKR